MVRGSGGTFYLYLSVLFLQTGFTSTPLSLQPHAPSCLQPARSAHLQPLSSASLGRYKERRAALRVSMCAFCVWRGGCTRPVRGSGGPVSASRTLGSSPFFLSLFLSIFLCVCVRPQRWSGSVGGMLMVPRLWLGFNLMPRWQLLTKGIHTCVYNLSLQLKTNTALRTSLSPPT